MPEAFICDYIRTPIGRYGGALSSVRADDLAAIPPLWFRVMNPKVIDWADGDLSKVNMCPRHKEKLYAKNGAAAPAASAA